MPVQGDEPSLVVALCNHYNLVFMLYAMCISFSCKFRTNATFACQVLYADLVFVLPYNLPKQIRDSGCVHACAFLCLFVCVCFASKKLLDELFLYSTFIIVDCLLHSTHMTHSIHTQNKYLSYEIHGLPSKNAWE